MESGSSSLIQTMGACLYLDEDAEDFLILPPSHLSGDMSASDLLLCMWSCLSYFWPLGMTLFTFLSMSVKWAFWGVSQDDREARLKPTNCYEDDGEKNKRFKLEVMLELMNSTPSFLWKENYSFWNNWSMSLKKKKPPFRHLFIWQYISARQSCSCWGTEVKKKKKRIFVLTELISGFWEKENPTWYPNKVSRGCGIAASTISTVWI